MTSNYNNCQHEWTKPRPGTIRETGQHVTAQQCVHCGTWLIEHDKPSLKARWPMTINLDDLGVAITPGPRQP